MKNTIASSKNILTLLMVVFAMSSCATTQVSDSTAKRVATTRLYAFQEPFTNSATIQVTRDTGMSGRACRFSFYIDGRLAAHIGDAETASFYIEQGNRLLKVGRDLKDSGICGVGGKLFDNWGVQRESFFAANESKRFRIMLPDMGTGTVDIQRTN